jgi:hypothetical protein
VIRGRAIPAVGLAVVSGLLVVAALVLAYVGHTIFNANEFADRASAALRDEAVSDEVAARVADELVETKPNLVAVQPVLESVVAGIVRGGAFQTIFRVGVADLHRAVFEGDEDTVVLTLADIGTTVRGALQALQPGIAKRVPAKADVPLVDGEMPAVTADLARVGDTLGWLPWVLLAVALGLALGAVAIARDGRAGVLAVGAAIAVLAAIALVGLRAGEALVLGTIESQSGRDAAGGVWDAFLGDLSRLLVLVAGAGVVIAAAASSLIRPVDPRAFAERASALVTRVPENRFWQAVRGVALVALGVLIAARPDQFVSLLATATGLAITYLGVAGLIRLTIAAPDEAADDRRRGRNTLIAAGITSAAILGAGALFVGADGLAEEPLAVETIGCNGSDELCDRAFDEVAVPASHNAMSAATNEGWLFAQQERDIADQLHDGIRGLLIDAHYGIPTQSGAIKTDFGELEGGEREELEAEIGQDAVDAALRIRDRIVNSPAVGDRGVYLCHAFCELGAIPIEKAFTQIRDFLAANPDEVLTVVIEDYVVPADIAAAVEGTGLIDDVYTGPVGPPWPTLREVIDSGGRALMLAEHEAGGTAIPWYHSAYDELVQETPYSFKQPALLTEPRNLTASCKPNRGRADASLFLINHWIDTSPAPKPSNAAKVNTREVLLDRVRHCEDQRDLLANLIAVDFYREGDLFGVAEELNAER